MALVYTAGDLIKILSGVDPGARIRVAVDEPEFLGFNVEAVGTTSQSVWLAISPENPIGYLPQGVSDVLFPVGE